MAITRSRPLTTELERLEPFKVMSAANRAVLAQGATVADCESGSVIMHKGQPVSGAHLVLGGRLRVFSIAPSGNEATLYFLDTGDMCVLSLNCLFNDLLYPAWVQAESATRIAIVPGVVYRRLFETEIAVQNLTVRALSTLVFRLMNELEQVHSSNHRQRLAQFILLHSNADGTLRMTQQQLARHLGTTREVIARLVGDFVDKKWIRTQRGGLRIGDLFGLRSVLVPARVGSASKKD